MQVLEVFSVDSGTLDDEHIQYLTVVAKLFFASSLTRPAGPPHDDYLPPPVRLSSHSRATRPEAVPGPTS